AVVYASAVSPYLVRGTLELCLHAFSICFCMFTHSHTPTISLSLSLSLFPSHTHTRARTHAHTHAHTHTHTHTDRHTHTYTCARPTEKLLYTQPHLSGVVILPSPPSFSLSLFRSSYSHDLDRVLFHPRSWQLVY